MVHDFGGGGAKQEFIIRVLESDPELKRGRRSRSATTLTERFRE